MHQTFICRILVLLFVVAAPVVASAQTKPAPSPPYSGVRRPMMLPGYRLDPAFSDLPAHDPAVYAAVPGWLKGRLPGKPLYIINGKLATVAQLNALKPTQAASINTIDGKTAAQMYGPNASQGLVVVTLKETTR